MHRFIARCAAATFAAFWIAIAISAPPFGDASSHREAPLISNDPLADNTDVYAFRSPDDPNTVTIVANYIPFELPEGGPNYFTFGEDILYEIHIKNKTTVGPLGSAKDDITYQFTFEQDNEDPNTFFNIRLGKQNLLTTYRVEKSTDGGNSFSTILEGGTVPPNNIGPRSIESTVGLGASYESLVQSAIHMAKTGEKVFAGPREDPFFVDLGGIFDLGEIRSQYGTDPYNPDNARDAIAGFNTHTIALQIPIAMLQKDGKSVDEATSILDPDFVIGVWASASRRKITVLRERGGPPLATGPWVQVSRLGMPLTNEAVIPVGYKDYWNAVTPYSTDEQGFTNFFANPELALYMDDSRFGGAVRGLSALRIPSMSYPAVGDLDGDGSLGFDFRNGMDGVHELVEAGVDLTGTAFDAPLHPGFSASGQARLFDVFPVFYYGIPNQRPYHLATGKECGTTIPVISSTGGPPSLAAICRFLSRGKPFIHNFLPLTKTEKGDLYGGDMIRLNMATPVTDRSSDEFRMFGRQGLLRAAVLGLTMTPYNTRSDLEFIPNMDGFPNGRRLEDDVTSIELQAVGGVVLASVGLPFDDATAEDYSDIISQRFIEALNFNAGPTANDKPTLSAFPFLGTPHRGFDYVKPLTAEPPVGGTIPPISGPPVLGVGVPQAFVLEQNHPNPFNPSTSIRYHVSTTGRIAVRVYDLQGRLVATLADREHTAGTHSVSWDASNVASGTYFYRIEAGGRTLATKQAVLVK